MKYRIINSDVYSGLLNIEQNSIDFAITSPPYWQQRDYGFDNQIGNERTYQEYIQKLVTNFDLLRNTLKPEGIFFLNVGDKYLSKYGKTPLGFIPYKLTYNLVKAGWFLEDIIIWYKPNHMPSSIKNRFANSYEPIFVLSKSQNNYYKEYISKNSNYSNILKIPLQPTPFKHVAVYPEKLVYELLNKFNIDDNTIILDPFAGSGTTLKVIKENFPSAKGIMIEANDNYIDIIKNRCFLYHDYVIEKYEYINYDINFTYTEPNINFSNNFIEFTQQKFTNIFNSSEEYYKFLNIFLTNYLRENYPINFTYFIGSKQFDLELICKTALLNNYGWILRNMLIIEENNKWFPVFMIVDDNKKTKYIFNYKNLNFNSKNNSNGNWNKINFIGCKVVNNLSHNKLFGRIIEIEEKHENGFPKYVIVEWNNQKFSREFVIYSEENISNNIIIDYTNFSVYEKVNLIGLEKEVCYRPTNYPFTEEISLFEIPQVNEYNGKYKNEKRINLGASPGARASLSENFFSLQRLYNVDQNFIADYLNYLRKAKGYTINDIINHFSEKYRHTVGHWFRKDFGGSLPSIEDWFKLSQLLDISNNITNYVCKTALKLQTVKNSEYKIPADFQPIDFIEKLNLLTKN